MSVIKTAAAILALCWAGAAAAQPFFGSDLVFPPKGFGRPHGASMVELENGGILATWFSSREETTKDARIFGAEWSRKTGKWTDPRTIIPDDYSKSVGNTALFRDDDGVIWMFFAAVVAGGWSGAVVDYVQSRDEGRTWSGGERLVGWPGNLPRNTPIRVGRRQMLVPLFVDFWYEAGLVGAYTALIKYKDGNILEKKYASMDDEDAIQPAVVKLSDGRILALMRDKTDRFIRRAWSDDGGESWSPVTMTTLPNPGAAIHAIYIDELSAVLLAYNHSRKGRNPLSLAVSTDGGMTFKRIADLEREPGDEEASFSYPTLLRTKDGLIHAIWSHDSRATLKHVRFNIDWLMERMARHGPDGEKKP
ncbi:MAG: sialidase family protein [Candidatus Nitrospinota bacterium M3_3B_026]